MLPRDLRDSIGDLVKGTVPLDLGLQAGGDLGFVFALPVDDKRDTEGKRLPAGALAAV
jgi:hypothetical protein